MPTLLLVDGHSLAFRSYYAHAKNREGGLRTKTGIPTSVSFGFMKALLDTMEQEKPDYVAIAFDPGEPTYRHEADQTYKEGRPDAPEDFLPDLSNLQELLQALKLPVISVPGYEADDVIGTLSRKAVSEGFRVKVLTGDRDLFQLIDDEQLTVLYLSTTFGKGTPPPREFGPQQVKDKMGISPQQVVDYKALCGDPSDNIPGVKGIGDKTAVSLLTQFGSLVEVYNHLDKIKGATRKKLEDGRDAARHSQYLAQIHLDVPLALRPEDCKLQAFDDATVVPILEKLEFRSFLNRLQKLHSQFAGEVAEPASNGAISPSPPPSFSPSS
ncbi:MAG: DNA polymerase I, partial [Cyanobacteria bacterium J069]